MSFLSALFAEPIVEDPTTHLTDGSFVELEPVAGEPSYLLCLSRTVAEGLIVENRSWLGRTIEVLGHGLLFETDCPLSTEDRIRIELAVENRLVEGTGEVLHVQLRPDGMWTVLFEYHDLSDEGRSVLAELTASR